MESEKYHSAISLVKCEFAVLFQGCLIAIFFFGVSAIGSYSEVEGPKFLDLFTALMGADYLIMGFLGYVFLIGLAGFWYPSAKEISRSNLGWSARAILIFPFIGFITPAFMFSVMNLWTRIFGTETVDLTTLLMWPSLAIGGTIGYLSLCCLPYILGRYDSGLSQKEMYSIVFLSCVLMASFIAEKVFNQTTYFLYAFIAFVVIVTGALIRLAWKEYNSNKETK